MEQYARFSPWNVVQQRYTQSKCTQSHSTTSSYLLFIIISRAIVISHLEKHTSLSNNVVYNKLWIQAVSSSRVGSQWLLLGTSMKSHVRLRERESLIQWIDSYLWVVAEHESRWGGCFASVDLSYPDFIIAVLWCAAWRDSYRALNYSLFPLHV